MAALVDALRLLPLVELLIDPQDGDHSQADIARIGGADGVETGEFDQAGKHFAQDGIAVVTDVKGMVGIRLGVLDHHALVFGRSTTEIVRLG